MGFFDKLKNGLNKTKTSFDEKINNVFKNFRKVDEDFLDELEEILIMSDIGMDTSIKIISSLRERIKKEKIQDEEDVKQALREEMQKILDVTDIGLHLNTKPSVILVVGVNGVGKTTSIDSTSKDIAKKVLDYYYTNGLNIVKETDDGYYVTVKEWLSYERYKDDLIILETLDENGFPPDNKYYNKKGDWIGQEIY